MKKIILTLIALVACGMVANAATKYQINVGGVEVTSDNASNVTGGDITGGTVSYNESTNTLRLNNVTISRKGSSSKYAVHNRDCSGLTIKFVGTCNLYSEQGPALKLQRDTKLNFYSGTSSISSKTNNAIAVDNNRRITFLGNGYANIVTTDGTADCIKGGGGSAVLDFCGGNITIRSNAGYAVNTFDLQFYWNTTEYGQTFCNVNIYANSTKQSIYNCTFYKQSGIEILEPYEAYYSESDKTICNSWGTPVKSDDILISNNYVAIINEDNFPDFYFRNSILSLYPKGYITQTDVNNRTSLNVSYKGIYYLTGLEYFNKLTSLDCNHNNIKSLPSLPSILTSLDCNYNQLTSLPPMPGPLEVLSCGNNKLTSLTLDNRDALRSVDCSNNPNLATVEISNNSNFKSLNVSNCTALTELYCSSNALTTLDVSGCTALKTLFCGRNQLTSLDVSSLNNLIQLDCLRNKLTSINVSNKTKLKILNVCKNQLTSINVQGCSAMEHLNCYDNMLSSVSVQGCSSLSFINISLNQIKESAMNTLINSLRTIPAGSSGELNVYYEGNDPREGNVITNAQVIAARNKRWIPKKCINASWVEITVKGDVNGDGKVNVSDVTALVNMILGTIPKDPAHGDINGDGNVNVSDVTALVNIILGQN